MNLFMAVVGAVLVLAGGAAHAIPFDRIPLISNTLGDVQNRLCAGAATPAGQADIACPSYSPYVTSGGLLGVGTSSPTATLQVSGSFIVSTSTQGSASPSLYVGTDGKVGIGTAAPSAALAVYGPDATPSNVALAIKNSDGGRLFDVRDDGLVVINGVGSSSGGLLINGTIMDATSSGLGAGVDWIYGDYKIREYAGDTNVARLTIQATTGNVGIGTTNPTTTLEVSGTVSATHFVGDGSGLTNLSVQGDRITSGTTNVTVNSATSTISFTTNGSVANYFDASGRLVTTGISVTTNQLSATTGYFSGNVGIGTTTPTFALDVSGSGNFYNSSPGNYMLIDPTNYNIDAFQGGAFGTRLNLNSGLELINFTHDPGFAMFIAGNGIIRTNTIESGGVAEQRYSPLILKSNLFGNPPSTPAIDLQVFTSNGSGDDLSRLQIYNGDSGNIVLLPNGLGNVGIGTLTPTAALQVSGGLIVSSTGQTSSPSLYVGTDGNVGIGTTSPQSALDINGALSFKGAGGTASITRDSYNGTGLTITYGSGGSESTYTVGNVFGSNDLFHIFVPPSGSYGNVESQGGLGLGLSTLGSHPIVFFPNRIEAMRITSSGNVGIGTTTPTTTLEVSGTVSATHFVGDGSGLTNLFVQGDRITSGTTNVIANQDTGVSVSAPMEVSGDVSVSGTVSATVLRLPNAGSVICDAAHINVVVADPDTGTMQLCRP